MQPVWLCIFSGRPFANAPWGKARRFEDSFEKSLNKCNQRNFASYRVDHLQMHHGEKPNKWLQPIWLCLLSGRCLQMHSGEKSNKCNQCDFASSIWGDIWNAWWRKVIQLQPMWICSHLCKRMQANATSVNFPFSGKWFEETFANTQWRQTKQMQPMWLCTLSGRKFMNTFVNTYWGKAKCKWHGQKPNGTMWLCIFSGRQFEDTFESAQCRKAKETQPIKKFRKPTPTKTW